MPPALAVLLLAAQAFQPGSLPAQSIPSPFQYIEERHEVGLFASAAATGVGRFDLGPRSGNFLGARYGIDVSGPFGLEGAIAYLPTTRAVIDPRPGGTRNRGDADVHLMLVDARLRFSLTGRRTWHGLNPFLFAGGGLAFDLAGDPALDQQLRAQDRFSLGVGFVGAMGAGLRWMLSDRLLLRGDGELLLWQLDTPDGFDDPQIGIESPPAGEWVNNFLFTIGLAIRF